MDDFTIDLDGVKQEIKQKLEGAYFGGGYGAALMESFELDTCSDQELIRKARQYGVNLGDHIVPIDKQEDNSYNPFHR